MVRATQLGLIVENLGAGEIVVIAFVALVVLGPERIPELARSAGRMINNIKKFGTDMTGDMQDVINDPSMQPIKELGEFAARPRQKLAEYALEAEAEERQRQARDGTGQPSSGDDAVAEDGGAGIGEDGDQKAQGDAVAEGDRTAEGGATRDADSGADGGTEEHGATDGPARDHPAQDPDENT